MTYFYDIVLNPNESLYEFFEWEDKDSIIYLKKIPVLRCDPKIIYNIMDNYIEVEESFFEFLNNKAETYDGKNESMCILSDGFISIGVSFINKIGKYVSKLLPIDENNIVNTLYKQDIISIKYNILNKRKKEQIPRYEIENKELIRNTITYFYNNKDINKLKYLYLEYFNKDIDDIEKIYKSFIKELDNNYSDKFNSIISIIKIIKI